MGKPPAIIIIARHGARLDAADKQWYLTSPTPYDPPLTYGGWLQSRALGARIASILQTTRESADSRTKPATANDRSTSKQNEQEPSRPRKVTKKHKIIIHSSPFIRCVQTSIAISAGIGQFRHNNPSIAKPVRHVLHSGSPRVHSRQESPLLPAILEPSEPSASVQTISLGHATTPRNRIAQLRIDAFLGEWLSPDYFENITPPPNSVMMVAHAKAELLRTAEPIEGAQRFHSLSGGHFPGGWQPDRNTEESVEEEEEDTGSTNNATTGQALPRSHRATVHGNQLRPVRTAWHANNEADPDGSTYMPPVPGYAITAGEPIPAGYVAHARDACVDVKFQWDSMRAPLSFGDGGKYGEEWSSMHKRFRNGLQRLVAWYKEHGTSTSITDDGPAEEDDEDTDTVLILVTHGAGCNALIGALTNQPVLLDVGMASLTLARIRSGLDKAQAKVASPPRRPRRESIDLAVSYEYEIEVMASTDHLRTGTVSWGLNTPRYGISPVNINRRAFNSNGWEGSGPSLSFATPMPENLRRTASGTHAPRSSPPSSSSTLSAGLWRIKLDESFGTPPSESESDSFPKFDGPRKKSVPSVADMAANNVKQSEMFNNEDSDAQLFHTPVRTNSQQGLWDGGPFQKEARDSARKRRWTTVQNT